MVVDEMYQRERYADFVRDAEKERRTRELLETSRKSFYKPALHVIGAKLVDIGNRLQENVDTRSRMKPIETRGT